MRTAMVATLRPTTNRTRRRLAALLGALLGALVPAAPAAAQTDAGNDFTQGTRVLFGDDFTRLPLGMFPRSLRLVEGNAEVARVNGRVGLRVTSYPSAFAIPLGVALPERFTLEFDYLGAGWEDELWFISPETDGADHVQFALHQAGIRGSQRDAISENGLEDDSAVVHHVAVMADGNYVKVYSNGRRVANVPNALLGRSRDVLFRLYASGEKPGVVFNIRLAAGGKDLYRALMEDGRMTLEGIEFDTGSDRLRPASDSVLKEVAAAMAKGPDLAVSIEGHTDNQGADATNISLSERRAAAVKVRLVALGVPATRLTTKGYGAAQPVAPNETPEGRQRNRRVELVRGN